MTENVVTLPIVRIERNEERSMTDVVQRIRSRSNDAPLPTERLLDEAADEIECLRSALVQIDAIAVTKKAGALVRMQRIAQRALSFSSGDRK